MVLEAVPDVAQYYASSASYALSGCLYDTIVIILSIFDTTTTIIVFDAFFTLQHSSHAVDQLFMILSIWLGCVQISYIIFFNIRLHVCDSLTCCNCLTSVLIAPLIPIVYYQIYPLMNQSNIFSTTSHHPFLHQLCTDLRNKHAAFMIQSVGESIPGAILQTLILTCTTTYVKDLISKWIGILLDKDCAKNNSMPICTHSTGTHSRACVCVHVHMHMTYQLLH